MRLTVVFLLTSVLFFGVSPSAVDKKECGGHDIVTSSASHCYSLAVDLATPIEGSVIGTAMGDGKSLISARRASSGRKKSKTGIKKSKSKKTSKKKAHTPIKGKGETNRKGATKTRGKGKTTGKKNKTKPKDKTKAKRNNELLRPTKGCIPRNCKKCGKPVTSKSKSGKKTGRKSVRSVSLHGPVLSRRAASFSPAEKTAAGLHKWTSEVWSTAPKDLDIDAFSGDFKPTSFFVKWSELGEGNKFVTLKSLSGCASIVVVSEVGVYISHHWQNTVCDGSLETIPQQFLNAFTNPMQSKAREQFRLTEKQRAYWESYSMPESIVKQDTDSVYPKASHFKPLTGARGVTSDGANPFSSTHNPQAAVIVWDGRVGNGEKYNKAGPMMKSLINDLVPGLPAGQPKLIEYSNSEEGATVANSDSDYHGKVIVSYDSATGAYEVWMAAASLTEPILRSN